MKIANNKKLVVRRIKLAICQKKCRFNELYAIINLVRILIYKLEYGGNNMSEFSINIGAVNGEPGRLNHVQQVVLSNVKTVEHAGDNLGSIGLADLKPNFQTLSNRLNLHAKNVESLSDALKKIVMKFEQTESGITNSVYLKDVVEFDIGPLYMDGPNPDTLGKNVLMDFAGGSAAEAPYVFDIRKYDELYHYDENGELVIEWDKIEELLAKDNLTNEEICQLAYAYMNMPEEDLGKFLSMCMDFEEDGICSYWHADSDKMASILHAVNNTLECDIQAEMNGEAFYTDEERRSLMERSSALNMFMEYSQASAVDPNTGECVPPYFEISRDTYKVPVYNPDGTINHYNEYEGMKIDILGPMTASSGGGLDGNFVGGTQDNREIFIVAPDKESGRGNQLQLDMERQGAMYDYDHWLGNTIIDTAVGAVGGNIWTGIGIGESWGSAHSGMVTAQDVSNANFLNGVGADPCYVIEGDSYVINEYNTADLTNQVNDYNNLPDNQKIDGYEHIRPDDVLNDPASFNDRRFTGA